jgi:hypothetical protein
MDEFLDESLEAYSTELIATLSMLRQEIETEDPDEGVTCEIT